MIEANMGGIKEKVGETKALVIEAKENVQAKVEEAQENAHAKAEEQKC